jgi:hypothetical protein
MLISVLYVLIFACLLVECTSGSNHRHDWPTWIAEPEFEGMFYLNNKCDGIGCFVCKDNSEYTISSKEKGNYKFARAQPKEIQKLRDHKKTDDHRQAMEKHTEKLHLRQSSASTSTTQSIGIQTEFSFFLFFFFNLFFHSFVTITVIIIVIITIIIVDVTIITTIVIITIVIIIIFFFFFFFLFNLFFLILFFHSFLSS